MLLPPMAPPNLYTWPAPQPRQDALARQPLLITLIVVVALAVLVQGWAALWFLCDDAFITFRYAAMARLGHGYVWNPPPMPPTIPP